MQWLLIRRNRTTERTNVEGGSQSIRLKRSSAECHRNIRPISGEDAATLAEASNGQEALTYLRGVSVARTGLNGRFRPIRSSSRDFARRIFGAE